MQYSSHGTFARNGNTYNQGYEYGNCNFGLKAYRLIIFHSNLLPHRNVLAPGELWKWMGGPSLSSTVFQSSLSSRYISKFCNWLSLREPKICSYFLEFNNYTALTTSAHQSSLNAKNLRRGRNMLWSSSPERQSHSGTADVLRSMRMKILTFNYLYFIQFGTEVPGHFFFNCWNV